MPVVLLTSLWLAAAGQQLIDPAQADAARPPADNKKAAAGPAADTFTEALVGDLTAKGFQVSQGYPKLYTFQDCIDHSYPVLKNCSLANPAAPYVVPVLRLWPDEYVDPNTENAVVDTDPGYSVTFRLDPREAVVIYGRMPPPGRYMGLQTWQFSGHGNWKPKDYNQWANTPDIPFPMQFLFDTVPADDPKSQRILSLSALGDVVNNVVMEKQSGYPFGETRYFIITPSAATDHAVRLALQAQGVPDSHIFTEQIPREDTFGPIGPLGMGKNAIDFFTAFRYAAPDDQAAGQNWRDTLPLTVLRLRAPDSLGPVQRYGMLSFAPRTANSEAALEGDLQKLVAAVCDSLGRANLTSTDCTQPPPATSFIPELVRDLGWTGPYCRSVDMDCNGDQQEAALYFSSPRPLDSGQVLAVVSTLATETGNSVYVGLSANDASMMAGVANVMDTDVNGPDGLIKGLKGSADIFAGTVNNSGKFFVHYFTENCDALKDVPGGTDSCSTTSGVVPALGDPALRGQFIIALRDYIATGTEHGPDPAKLLTPRILTFIPQ
ncbi:MAG TPA: hypothetical protein VJ550_13080 [Geomonas sp.]|nr:hypothetical protein [Geomonas sp.]